MEQSRNIEFEVPEKLAVEAESLGLNVAEASRRGLWLIIDKTRKEAEWREQNRDAIKAHNEWIEKHGLPLERYRLF